MTICIRVSQKKIRIFKKNYYRYKNTDSVYVNVDRNFNLIKWMRQAIQWHAHHLQKYSITFLDVNDKNTQVPMPRRPGGLFLWPFIIAYNSPFFAYLLEKWKQNKPYLIYQPTLDCAQLKLLPLNPWLRWLLYKCYSVY